MKKHPFVWMALLILSFYACNKNDNSNLKGPNAAMPSFTLSAAQTQVSVPKWQPHDFDFKSTQIPANPFTAVFSADFTGPNGVKLTLPGFYDGGGIWKVRFSPTVEGAWSVTSHSNVADINNQKTAFSCSPKNNNEHGGLQIETNDRHHFVFQDGTHWFPSGYECNWLWALDATNNTLPTVNTFLDKLGADGFNFILVNAYAYDTSWRPGKTSADDYGPSPLYPWNGTNQNPDFSRFNIAYWQHYDQMIDALYKHGFVAHIYLKVYNKGVTWPQNNSADDDMYYKWIIARYAAYPNIIWDLAKEANNEKSVSYKVNRLKMIRATDPYHRLLTVHTDINTYDAGIYNNLVDFRSDQFVKGDLHALMLSSLSKNDWPVINVESGYEYGPNGPNDKTYNVVQSPEEVARRIWEIKMAGGYTAYYYTYTAWDVLRPHDTPKGYGYLKNFNNFFAQTQYWLLKPSDGLVSTGYCIANTGTEYVVFQNTATSFTLDLTALNKTLNVEWFEPYTGQTINAGTVQKGKVKFTPPANFGTGPVALRIH